MRRWGSAALFATPRSTEFKANPNFAHEGEGREKTEMETSLFPNWTYNEANAGACRST